VIVGGVDEGVLEGIEGIVGRLGGELEEVGLGVGDLGPAGEALAQGAGRAAGARAHDDQAAAADRVEALRDAAVERGEHALLALAGDALLEADQQAPLGRGSGGLRRSGDEQDG
jgi:hypothetical protein